MPTTTMLEILALFQPLSKDINLNMQEAYQDMLRHYLKQYLVVARGANNKQKIDTPGPKNFHQSLLEFHGLSEIFLFTLF